MTGSTTDASVTSGDYLRFQAANGYTLADVEEVVTGTRTADDAYDEEYLAEVRQAVNQPVGQDFGSAPTPLGEASTNPGRADHERTQAEAPAALPGAGHNKHTPGGVIPLYQFAFPAFDHNRPGPAAQGPPGLRLPGFHPPLAALAAKTRDGPCCLPGPDAGSWSQLAGGQTRPGGNRCLRQSLSRRSTLMAHELDINNGVASFAARTDAWHRLGQSIGHSMVAEEALAMAQLSGWSVHKRRLVVPLEPLIIDRGVTTPAPLPVDDHFATVRTNPITGKIDVLGVVGSKYEPVQNEEFPYCIYVLMQEVTIADRDKQACFLFCDW